MLEEDMERSTQVSGYGGRLIFVGIPVFSRQRPCVDSEECRRLLQKSEKGIPMLEWMAIVVTSY